MARPRLLALASGGGHWIQLLRLRPAFAGFEVSYVSTFENYSALVPESRFHTVADASRFDLKPFVPIAWRALRILVRERPAALVTTGSAPMLVFVILARLLGCRTLWVDSIANSERLSSSGRMAKKVAHKVVTQWPDVAALEDVECWGRIL